MQKPFYTQEKVTTTVRKQFTPEQLEQLIISDKPTEIFNEGWSNKAPFIVITEYNEEGFMLYCNGWADKSPQQYSADKLYNFLKYQGLETCYIKLV